MARKRKKKGLKVDFTGVEGRILLPEDDYRAKVEEISKEESQTGNDYLQWKFRTISDDKYNNKPLFYNTSLQPQALWNLRNLLETLGVEVPDSEMELDLKDYVDRELILTVEHDVYEGQKRNRVVDFMPLDDEDEDGDEDEEDVEVEDDEEEGDEEEDEAEDDEEGDDEDEEEDEDDGEEEDEDGEEEEEGFTEAEIKKMTAKELAELVEEYELEVSVKKIRGLKKKQSAVISALEEAELLTDDE